MCARPAPVGFGKSDTPPRGDFDYTFDHLAQIIDRWTGVLGVPDTARVSPDG
jgi:hypothetical protein